jgi:DNA-binding NtrC family response regulator
MALLLIVSEEETIRDKLLDLFSEEHTCRTNVTAEGALSELKARDFDLVITVVSDKVDGEELLGVLRTYRPRTPIIVICRAGDKSAAERLVKKGAFGYLLRPFRAGELAERVDRAIEYRLRTIGGRRQTVK